MIDQEKINERDDLGMTPLLRAIFIGDEELVEKLLAAGADPNVPSGVGDMPLWHAEDDFGLFKIAEILRTHGARKD